MSEGTLFRRLHGSAIRVQVPVILATIPLASALWGIALVPIVVEAVAADGGTVARAAARSAALTLALALLGCVTVATAGAALLLRGSMRTIIERLQAATAAIAAGDFSHRVESSRGDELGALAASIDRMAERLDQLEQSRRRMLASISHELRTPLTIIRGHAYTLARSEPAALRRDRLELMQDEAARLGELIEDLVDASTLQAGSVRLRIERCDLVTLADLAVARFAESASMRGVHIERRGAGRALPVDVDPARIEQVLANLLANAVRHADAGSTIVVDVPARRRSAERALTVSNDGPAVPAELVDSIFEPFVQGVERAGRVGLGMSIARGLAVAHGGELSLELRGECDDPVRFRLTLPAPSRGTDVTTASAARIAPPRAGLQVAGS